MDGPDNVCIGFSGTPASPVEYFVSGGGGSCFSSGTKWEIKRSNGLMALAYQTCSNGEIRILAVNPQYVEVTNAPVAQPPPCAATAAYHWYNIPIYQQTLGIIWKVADTYEIEASPGGTPTLCQKAKKTVRVWAPNTPFSIGNLSGPTFVECTVGGGTSITYAVPAVDGVTSYRWTFATNPGSSNSLNAFFNSNTSVVTNVPNATAQFFSINGVAQGTLRMEAFGPCGAYGSRVFAINRGAPSSAVTFSSSNGCMQCYQAPVGSNYQWSLAGTPPPGLFIDGPTTGTIACVRSTSTQFVGGYLQVAYNGGCANERIISGTSFSISPCFGGRRSAERTVVESVSPNPASDVVNISFPSDRYEVSLTNALGKQVHRQAAVGHECRVEVGNLSNGVYILQIRDNTNVVPPSKHRVVVAH